MRNFAKVLFIALLLAGLLYYLAFSFEQRKNGMDFLHFYTAARMVKEGYGHQLYDPAAQREFQARYTGRVGTYFNHPAFEALLYLPFALLPLAKAYIVWNLANGALLLWFAKLLQCWVVPRADWFFLAALSFLFVPVLLSFLQGQDAILLLFLITAALAALHRQRENLAGGLLACGLFKFHLVLPIMAILLFTRNRKPFSGFLLGALALLLISVGVSGWTVVVDYPRFLIAQNGISLSGIHPLEMANLRGLMQLLGVQGTSRIAASGIASVFVIGLALRPAPPRVSAGARNLHYARSALAAVLVSYHLSPHDLTVLLLPMAVLAGPLLRAPSSWAKNSLRLTWLAFFLPPLHLWLLAMHLYVYMVIPVLIFFLATCDERALLVLGGAGSSERLRTPNCS